MKIENVPFTLLLCALVVLSSCSDKETPTQQLTQTPKALTKGNMELSDMSIGRFSYSQDLITELYEEAVDNNKKLADLDQRLKQIADIRKDSLELFYEYSRSNERYWNEVTRYTSQLTDSTLRASVNEIFSTLRKDYEKSMAYHDSLNSNIKLQMAELQQQSIVLKLAVTLPMMLNYQINEMPSEKPLENVLNEYTELINATKAQSELKK
jgi:hypothetical protein